MIDFEDIDVELVVIVGDFNNWFVEEWWMKKVGEGCY